jgi:dTDP-N-acetylfucosamine:lipid II N-acetylfucosaminyltransferase
MNLHILPDSKFSDRFHTNLKELNLLDSNLFVVRSNERTLKFVRGDVPVAKLYSDEFSRLTGNTMNYEKVFIHQFTPLMYRWVATNNFKELHWCVWGADVYNLPGAAKMFYEPMTWNGFSRYTWVTDVLYTIKLYATNMYYRKAAYAKVNSVLTWMKSEFEYVQRSLNIPAVQWNFFFYENDLPYEQLDQFTSRTSSSEGSMKFILGNSGTDTNNHVDAVAQLAASGVQADLVIPVSYGSHDYVSFLKKSLSFYKNGSIEFLDRFLPFDDYLKMLMESDGLIMNHLRPQGYGNILMMMYLNKPVFLNPRNLSIADLDANGLKWIPIERIADAKKGVSLPNKEAVQNLLSHERLLETYRTLFGKQA